jgi:dolichol-phosphate mannosyltransferase
VNAATGFVDEITLNASQRLAVVIPAYKVSEHIMGVLADISPLVHRIYVVDDCCPEGTGELVTRTCSDSRVRVIRHDYNQGVGGAVITGYRAAMEEGCSMIVKIDGDGQMDTGLIPDFVAPILAGEADYTKGNRFFDLEGLASMPGIRLFGNALLSFMAKLSSGYWNLFDPTNGYTAIHVDVARRLPFDKISRRYFFETDMLFRLNTLRAVVVDVPMVAVYANEVSNMKINKIIGEFAVKHARNCIKRIFYNYYLRDMSVASIELPLGIILLTFGVSFGGHHWLRSIEMGQSSTAGTVMLSALPVLAGLQMLLAFISYDVSSVPTRPLHKKRYPRVSRTST